MRPELGQADEAWIDGVDLMNSCFGSWSLACAYIGSYRYSSGSS